MTQSRGPHGQVFVRGVAIAAWVGTTKLNLDFSWLYVATATGCTRFASAHFNSSIP
jgi:hypothetical protein